MKSQNTIFNLNKIVAGLMIALFVAGVSAFANTGAAKLGKQESVAIAVKSLSGKLKNDLVLKSVSVKFNKTEQYFVSDREVGVRGEGTARLDGEANDLPMNFDVKIDVAKRDAADVKYVFLNMEGASAPTAAVTSEDIVTEKLLKKIKSDYKTENIVIAVDALNVQVLGNGEEGLTGVGEVQVNGMGWKKISFDVKTDADKTKMTIVKYQIK